MEGSNSHNHSAEARDGIKNQNDLESSIVAIEKESATDPEDPNLVQWEGPDDPRNPKNWQKKRKWAAVITCKLNILREPNVLGEVSQR